jgi:hypothetical protein
MSYNGQKVFDTLISLAKHNKQTFGRQVSSEIYRPTSSQILAVVKMHDDYHDMRLAILIEAGSLTVESIGAQMDRIPYPICEQALQTLEHLKGLCIFKRGILKEIKSLIPKAYGCTHLGELIEAGLRSLFAEIEPSMFKETLKKVSTLSLEEERHLFMHHETLKNTCVAFNADNQDPEVAASITKALQST